MDEDIDSLIGNMKIQFEHLRHDYGFNLLSIEDEFERERSELLKHNLDEIETFFNKHRETERKFSEDKMRK